MTAAPVGARTRDSEEFRALFPALDQWAWFDTPGSPPGAQPVTDALTAAVSDWSAGMFDWKRWDAASETARRAFAALIGADPGTVSVLGSVAEGVSTVARSLPPGSIVVADNEYRSVLYPLAALDQDRNPLVRVVSAGAAITAAELGAAVRDDTVLVAVSDTLTATGNRVDLPALRGAADRVGARLLVDLTQSLGVLDHDFGAINADHLVVHGYKWLLCPRGSAWLVSRADRWTELAPLLPGWKSTDPPHGYFGGPLRLSDSAARLDTSPAWFSWIGSVAALDLIAALDRPAVEVHCVALAQQWHTAAVGLGYTPVLAEQHSHIAVIEVGDAAERLTRSLIDARVRATVNGTRLRIGVHYFNSSSDVARLIDVLGPADRWEHHRP